MYANQAYRNCTWTSIRNEPSAMMGANGSLSSSNVKVVTSSVVYKVRLVVYK